MAIRPGFLAAQAGYCLAIEVLMSAAGFYIGTSDEEGPVSRESVEYFPSQASAILAMESGAWTQRDHP